MNSVFYDRCVIDFISCDCPTPKMILLCFALLPAGAVPGSFDWIQSIATGPPGRKVLLEAKTYFIDKQYQLPRGTELRGAGTALGHRTVIQAVGEPYAACAGTVSQAGLTQGRKGLLLGDDTFVGGFHFVGCVPRLQQCRILECTRLTCTYPPSRPAFHLRRGHERKHGDQAPRLSVRADRNAGLCQQRRGFSVAAQRGGPSGPSGARPSLRWRHGQRWQRCEQCDGRGHHRRTVHYAKLVLHGPDQGWRASLS